MNRAKQGVKFFLMADDDSGEREKESGAYCPKGNSAAAAAYCPQGEAAAEMRIAKQKHFEPDARKSDLHDTAKRRARL